MLGPLTDVLDRNSRIRILRTFPIFATKSTETLDHIVSQLEIKAFSDGQCVFQHGDNAVSFYIVKSGCVKLIKKSVDAETSTTQTQEVLLKANDTFGVEALDQLGTYNTIAISCGRSQCQRLKMTSLTRQGSRQFTQRVSMPAQGIRKFTTISLDDIQMVQYACCKPVATVQPGSMIVTILFVGWRLGRRILRKSGHGAHPS